MSSRKETPDVLGEILNSPAKPTQSAPAAAKPKPTQASSAPKAVSKSKQPVAAGRTALRWEYMEVTFREFRGWRPRYINGEELPEWKDQPEIVDYLGSLGQDGWEMIAIINGRRNTRDAYFKRVCDHTTS
jgi:FMN phosphatase YigB (HAD superfamily)